MVLSSTRRVNVLVDDMKKLKKKKPKPSAMSTLDALWSKAVRLLHRNKCAICGRKTTLNAHHLFSRSTMSVRWDVDNGMCLCAYHHMLGNVSAHKSPLLFAEFMIKERGQEWYASLLKKASPEFKLGATQVDKSAVEKELQEKYKLKTKELIDE